MWYQPVTEVVLRKMLFSQIQFPVFIPQGGFMMRRLPMISFLFLLLCAPVVVAQSANAAGTWDANVTSPQGPFNFQLILKQEGEKVSGVVKGERGETPIEGTLTGKDLKLKYTIKFQDNDMVIALTGTVKGSKVDFEIKGQQGTRTYTGTIEKDGSMKGTVQLGDVGSGTWTGKRQ